MAADYDEAVAELYQGPHATFVAERKRLAAELKEAGDKTGASKLGKLPRPPISAWTVNQLWWQAREDVEALFEAAAALRDDLGAAAGHREAIAKLRQRAVEILTEAGNAATEATLRRVTTTLQAIGATGSFDPDPPGALGDDRDPPGFEALGIGGGVAGLTAALAAAAATPSRAADKPKAKASKADDEAADQKRRDQEATRARVEAEAARRKADDEAARRRSEKNRLEAAIRNETGEIEARKKEVERLQKQIKNLQESILQSSVAIGDMTTRLEALAEEGE